MKTINEAARWLSDRDNFLILTHRRPDGDAVGCAIALCLGLRQIGKTAVIWENPQFTERYLPRLAGLTGPEPEGAVVISVDLATEGLLPVGGEGFAGRTQLALDHHPSNTGYAAETLVQEECAACGELIYDLLLELGVQVNRDMAEALYIAVSTDSGCFRYSNTTARTLRTAAATVECGAVIRPLNRELFEVKSLGRLQLEARMLAGMEFFPCQYGKVAICCAPQSWIEELQLNEDEIDSLAGFPGSISGVRMAALIRDSEPGRGKISLRSSEYYNASDVCRRLGGGGHAAAAGASVPGTLEDAKQALIAVLKAEGIILS